METGKTSRWSLVLNMAIAVVVLTSFARLVHLSSIDFDEHQVFALGFGLGLILSGSVILQVRPARPIVGFLLGVLGILCFAFAVV
jgi:hypothetical protein